jgi:hypothetical protein
MPEIFFILPVRQSWPGALLPGSAPPRPSLPIPVTAMSMRCQKEQFSEAPSQLPRISDPILNSNHDTVQAGPTTVQPTLRVAVRHARQACGAAAGGPRLIRQLLLRLLKLLRARLALRRLLLLLQACCERLGVAKIGLRARAPDQDCLCVIRPATWTPQKLPYSRKCTV